MCNSPILEEPCEMVVEITLNGQQYTDSGVSFLWAFVVVYYSVLTLTISSIS